MASTLRYNYQYSLILVSFLMSKHPDCLIIGGGLIGMLTARELALAGLQVSLLERGETGRESSWAGGGILSPLYPWRYSDAVSDLAQYSQKVYPELVAALKDESGVDAQWTQSGLLMPDCPDIESAQHWAKQYGSDLQYIENDELTKVAPELSPALSQSGAVWMPKVAQVRNPRFASALRRSIDHLGVQVLTNTTVKEISLHAGKVEGVITTGGEQLLADKVVLASGAWSAGLLENLGLELPVSPVRGQMLLYKTQPDTVKRIILNQDRYVIPRRDGRVLVGSTQEHTGFEKQTTDAAREELSSEAQRIIPALADFPIEAHWAGLRPGSPDGVPFIGACPEAEGLYLNTGHFRNGVILGPASAALMASIILENKFDLSPLAYTPTQTSPAAQLVAG